jgi:hypothetical protein
MLGCLSQVVHHQRLLLEGLAGALRHLAAAQQQLLDGHLLLVVVGAVHRGGLGHVQHVQRRGAIMSDMAGLQGAVPHTEQHTHSFAYPCALKDVAKRHSGCLLGGHQL